MNNQLLILILSLVAMVSTAQHHHPSPSDSTKPRSPRMAAMDMVGDNHVHIDYGAPSVRGRTIWNGLVAYGNVWATGAHKATWVEFSQPVLINGTTVDQGRYGLFTIPGKKEWTVILSKDWDMHLADQYDPSRDVVRVIVKPKRRKVLAEMLTFEVLPLSPDRGRVVFSWEYLTVSLDFKNQ